MDPRIKSDDDGIATSASGLLAMTELPLGRLTAFHGQMGMYVRALTYMLSHGADGMRQASEDAVLNANYIKSCLEDVFSVPFEAQRTPSPLMGEGPAQRGVRVDTLNNHPHPPLTGHLLPSREKESQYCMHEALFDDTCLKDTGITTLDLAKAMIDEGYHPMTMYFPLVVHGAMLIEPTESESLASLDLFIMTMRDLIIRAKSGDPETIARFKTAPHFTPRARLDETRAARSPKLRWGS